MLIDSAIYGQNVEFTAKNFPNQKAALAQAKKDIKNGDNYFKNTRQFIDKALNHYLKANNFNGNNALLNYKIGLCYLVLGKTDEAIAFMEKSRRLSPSSNKNLYYQLGTAYQNNLQFEKAIEYYKAYMEILNKKEFSLLYADIQRLIGECELGKTLSEKPVRAFIDNLGTNINTIYPEYSPIVTADESRLYFSSRRPDNMGTVISKTDGLPAEDIYYSDKQNSEWQKVAHPQMPLNTANHDAIVGLTPDGQTLLIYRAEKGGDIYECKIQGNQWSEPQALPTPINSKYHESSASYSFDGKIIYFDSNRPGGYGGHDIYKIERKSDGTWGEAENLGPTINTAQDEESVFLHPDGITLYFSSNGHPNLGGYDIFKASKHNGEWDIPINLGYPVNSPDDDKYFSITANNKKGYYSTTKANGYGLADIYQIIFLGEEKKLTNNTEDQLLSYMTEGFVDTSVAEKIETVIQESQMTLLSGTILGPDNMPMNAIIEIIDNKSGLVLATFESNSATGKYLVSLPAGKNYGITVKSENYLFHSENFDVAEGEGFSDIKLNIQMQEKKVGSKLALRNVFFDFNKWELKKESFTELNRIVELLKENQTMEMEISGHTDNIGSEKYNLQLSEKRAKSVYNYLISAGVESKRLQYQGYGFSLPIDSNETEEGRSRNRRTEIQILKE